MSIINIFTTQLSLNELFRAAATAALSDSPLINELTLEALPDNTLAVVCDPQGIHPVLIYKVRQKNLALYSSHEDNGEVVIAADEDLCEAEVTSFLHAVMKMAALPASTVDWLVNAVKAMANTPLVLHPTIH